jgi:ABC-type branched-subunit amino acid transport system substrate-binding protein
MRRLLSRRSALRGAAITVGTGLAGCSSSSGDGQTTTAGPTTETATGPSPDVVAVIAYMASGVQIFENYYAIRSGDDEEIVIPDGLKNNALPEQVGKPLANVTGTAPAGAGPNQDTFAELFVDEYGTEPGIFTSHTFDAVSILLLANVAAGDNDGSAIRDQMRRVTDREGQTVGPETLAEGVEAAARGERVNYVGASSRTEFDKRGDPASASYEIWQFDSGTETGFRTLDTIGFTGSPGGTMADSSPGGKDRTAKIGLLLPETGDLGMAGKPMRKAGELAISIVQNADVSVDVDLGFRDTETDPNVGVHAAQNLIDAGYPCVVGPASSGVNEPVATQALIPNQVVGCSPSSTALSVSFLQDDGYVFRTAPSDLLQGQVLAQVASERVGGSTTATMYVDNDYGRQLSDQYVTSFDENHGGTVWNTVPIGKERDTYREPLTSVLSKST